MADKVKGGTVNNSGESLCISCRNGQVITTKRCGSKIYCSQVGVWIGEKVIQCSEYGARGKPALYEFERLAWTLQTGKNRGPIGFKPPERKDDRIV